MVGAARGFGVQQLRSNPSPANYQLCVCEQVSEFLEAQFLVGKTEVLYQRLLWGRTEAMHRGLDTVQTLGHVLN